MLELYTDAHCTHAVTFNYDDDIVNDKIKKEIN